MSQQKLGNAICVSAQQIKKYESGTDRISAGSLYRFATYLKVDLDDFYAGFCESCQVTEKL